MENAHYEKNLCVNFHELLEVLSYAHVYESWLVQLRHALLHCSILTFLYIFATGRNGEAKNTNENKNKKPTRHLTYICSPTLLFIINDL